jgi:hypothetical protein
MSQARLGVAVIAVLLLLMVVFADIAPGEKAGPSAGPSGLLPFHLDRSVISSGGSPGATQAFESNGTLGEPALLGEGLGGDNSLRTGFWCRPPAAISSLTRMSRGPGGSCLFQNVPNPFISSTTIAYVMAGEGVAKISVFNVRGRRVRTLIAGTQTAGVHFAIWDGSDCSGRRVSPGIYFYRMETDDYTGVRKMIVAK